MQWYVKHAFFVLVEVLVSLIICFFLSYNQHNPTEENVTTATKEREWKIGKKLYTGMILRSGEGGATVAAGPGCASEQDSSRDYGGWKWRREWRWWW